MLCPRARACVCARSLERGGKAASGVFFLISLGLCYVCDADEEQCWPPPNRVDRKEEETAVAQQLAVSLERERM